MFSIEVNNTWLHIRSTITAKTQVNQQEESKSKSSSIEFVLQLIRADFPKALWAKLIVDYICATGSKIYLGLRCFWEM